MSQELPIRTQVRDAFVSALRTIDTMPTVRVKGADIAIDYLSPDQVKKDTTYCVIVEDEDPEEISLRTRNTSAVVMTVLIVIYVRDSTDRLGMQDKSIEDIFDVLRYAQSVKSVVPFLEYGGIETDQAATSTKPFAVAKMKWICKAITRPQTW